MGNSPKTSRRKGGGEGEVEELLLLEIYKNIYIYMVIYT